MNKSESITALEPILPAQQMRMASDVAGVCREIVLKTANQIQGKKFVRVEGWEAIATAHGCFAGAGEVERVYDKAGELIGYQAKGYVRNGRGDIISTGEGFVGFDEKDRKGNVTWKNRAEYAGRAMAQTRAISRACRSAFAHVIVLIDSGLSTTPAEEVPDGGFLDAEVIGSSNLLPGPDKEKAGHGKGHGTGQTEIKAPAPAASETDVQKRIRFLSLFAPYAPYATELFRHYEFVLPTEDYDAIGAEVINRFTKARVDALLADVKRTAGASDNVPESEPLPPEIANIIVPIPRKGMKRDEYLKHPDTIGSLYEAASNDEASANRLFGLVSRWEPSGWVGSDDKARPPSQADVKFRLALDRFAEWRERNEKK